MTPTIYSVFELRLHSSFDLHVFVQLVGAAFGAAGQRCMALSTAIFVGEAKEWIPELIEKAKKLKVNAGIISLILQHVKTILGFA